MASKQFELYGVGVVNATPLTADGHINEGEYRRHVRFLADEGISYIQPAAATGQALSTSDDEYRRLLEMSVDEVGDRLAVTAYSGRDSTEETIRLTKEAAAIGARCAFIIQPYFSRPDAEGVYRHYASIAEAVDLPLVIYNNPDRAGIPMPVSVLTRIAENYPQYVGLKQSNMDDLADSMLNLSQHLHVMPKSEKEMLYGFTLGSKAVLTFVGNVAPRQLVSIWRSFMDGDVVTARSEYLRLLPLINAVHIEPVPGAIKYMLGILGWDFGPVRLPGYTLSEKNADIVSEVLASVLGTDRQDLVADRPVAAHVNS